MEFVKRSGFFRGLVIVYVLVFVIGGIVAGNIFKLPTRYSFESDFNTTLMFLVWISGAFYVLIWYAIYVHIQNQEVQIRYLQRLDETLLDFFEQKQEKSVISEKTKPGTSNSNFSLDEFLKQNKEVK